MADLAGQKSVYFGFTGPIDSAAATRIAAAVNSAVNSQVDEIHLSFSSLGGYVADGIYLYNHLRGLPVKITAYNVGSTASIAVAVFVAAQERYCSSHSMFMIHPTAFPSLEGMSAGRLDGALQAALADDERTENILRERAALPDDILTARKVRDVHITPADALKFGLVQGIREFSLPKGQQIFQI